MDNNKNPGDSVEYTEITAKLEYLTQTIAGWKKELSLPEFLQECELLLGLIFDFLYYRTYKYDGVQFELISYMCPDEISDDKTFLQKSISKQEILASEFSSEDDDEILAVICIPYKSRDGILGVFVLFTTKKWGNYSDFDKKLLHLFSSMVNDHLEIYSFQDKLVANKVFLQCLQNSIPIAILIIDNNRQVINFNRMFELYFQQEKKNLINQRLEHVLPIDISVLLIKKIHNSNSNQYEGENDFELKLPNELTMTLGVSIFPLIDVNKNRRGYIFTFRDVSITREVSKLRQRDSTKDAFLSLVAHELRTPLASIVSYAEALVESYDLLPPETIIKYLKTIYNSGSRLSRMVTDTLTLTRLESGKMAFIFSEVDIQELIAEAILSVKSLAIEKQINLVEKSADSIPKILMDPDKITQVVLNIMSNAIKFTPSGGMATIAVNVTSKENQRWCQIDISDTGIGISPEDMDKVFSKFERIEKSVSGEIGTGLGMAISKQIIEDGHGGEIWVESEKGVGTTFSFTIPLGTTL